jgi:alkylated DNA repair dioxygenase AlkB
MRLLMCLRFATGETHAISVERLKEPTAVKVSLQARASHIGKHDASANPMKLIPDQPDLFDEAPLDGLSQASAIVSPDEEQMLIGSIDATELSPFRFHGWLGKRLTASYGWRYDFDDASFAQVEAVPDWLLPLRAKAAEFASLEPTELVQALLIRYDPGAGIGWHRDRPVFEHVLGVSLGAPATMRFRRRKPGGFDRAAVVLAPRSVYHLTGEARHCWEHSITPLEMTRWSITFRSLSEKGRLLGVA